MRITDLRATGLSIPRRDALETSYGSRDDAHTVFVELETDSGLTGIGQSVIEAPFYGETLEGTLIDTRRHLAPLVVGQSPSDMRQIVQEMQRALPDHPVAITAVEVALWDLAGKALDVPVYQLLGGKIRDGINLMGALPHGSPEALAEAAYELVDRFGYRFLKLKIGIDPEVDLAAYRAVVEAIEGRALVHVDANAGYRPADAQRVLHEMERIGGLGVVEQPVRRLDDVAQIARRLSAPVMVDESLAGVDDAIDVVRVGAIGLAFLKISRLGGLFNTWRVANILSAAGLRLAIGIYYDVLAAAACQLAAAAPGIDWPAPQTSMRDSILESPLATQHTQLRAADGPGLGVRIDRDRIARYAIDA